MLNKIPETPREHLKAVQILFYVMFGGVIFFAVVMYGLQYLSEPVITEPEQQRIFLIVYLFVASGCLTAASLLFRKRLSSMNDTRISLINKLNNYRAALVIYLALCEGPALFAMILYFLTRSNLFLAAMGICLLAMLLKRPVKNRIFNDLQLNTSEQLELN